MGMIRVIILLLIGFSATAQRGLLLSTGEGVERGKGTSNLPLPEPEPMESYEVMIITTFNTDPLGASSYVPKVKYDSEGCFESEFDDGATNGATMPTDSVFNVHKFPDGTGKMLKGSAAFAVNSGYGADPYGQFRKGHPTRQMIEALIPSRWDIDDHSIWHVDQTIDSAYRECLALQTFANDSLNYRIMWGVVPTNFINFTAAFDSLGYWGSSQQTTNPDFPSLPGNGNWNSLPTEDFSQYNREFWEFPSIPSWLYAAADAIAAGTSTNPRYYRIGNHQWNVDTFAVWLEYLLDEQPKTLICSSREAFEYRYNANHKVTRTDSLVGNVLYTKLVFEEDERMRWRDITVKVAGSSTITGITVNSSWIDSSAVNVSTGLVNIWKDQIDTLPDPIAYQSAKMNIDERYVMSDIPTTKTQAVNLFDNNTATSFGTGVGEIEVRPWPVISGTEITGSLMTLDFGGTVHIDSIRVFDGSAQPTFNVYTGTDFYTPEFQESLFLDAYQAWRTVVINKEMNYFHLQSLENLYGFNELEFYGYRIDTVEVPSFEIHHKPIDSLLWVTYNDYDHFDDYNPEGDTLNQFNANPIPSVRVYTEGGKSFSDTTFTPDGAPGSFDLQMVEDYAGRGGMTMFVWHDEIPAMTNKWPKAIRDAVGYPLPNFPYDSTATLEQNKINMEDPAKWMPFVELMLKPIRYLVENGADEHVIWQIFNEMAGLWKTYLIFLTPEAVAACYSAFWDGHEGEYGEGIKDIAPKIQVAWMAQAYNNVGYLKRAKLYFEKIRSDNEFCADIICVNTYPNSTGGLQHADGSHAIPPEGTYWVEDIAVTSAFAHSLGKLFYVTESGIGSSGRTDNNNSVYIEAAWAAYDSIMPLYPENQQYAYEEIFWPIWGDSLYYYQSAWIQRLVLEALPYVDGFAIYNYRDVWPGLWNTSSYHADAGLLIWVEGLPDGIENYYPKPSAIDIKNFRETLTGYRWISREQVGDEITTTLSNGVDEKVVTWTTAPNSKPEIN